MTEHEGLDRWVVNQRALIDANFPERSHWVVASWTPFHWWIGVCSGSKDWPVVWAHWECRSRESAEELFFTVTATDAHLLAEEKIRDQARANEMGVKHFG